MSTAPEDRPAAHDARSWKLSLRFLLALGWLLLVTSISFVRASPKPRPPAGEPETWKVCLLAAMTIVVFGGFVALTAYGHPQTMPPGLAH
ncbi:MAG: hypothetical protein ACLPTB_12405 [Acidimicrobiales bacterium]